jgi:hypothetical protein
MDVTFTAYLANTKYSKLKFKYTDDGEILQYADTTNRTYARLVSVAEQQLGELYREHLRGEMLGCGSSNHINTTNNKPQQPACALPFDRKGFRVLIPKWVHSANMGLYIGSHCRVTARVQKYELVSKSERNLGETVVGFTLTLVKIDM